MRSAGPFQIGNTFLLAIFVLFLTASAPHQGQSPNKGVIYGTAINPDGTPAKGLMLNAHPLGVILAMPLPWAKTNDAGAYRFEHLPFGRYTVFAEDKEAGYSMFSTGAGSTPGHPPEVELSVEHPEAEFTVHLPPKAGFVLFHLTNRATGAPIAGITLTVMSGASPQSRFSAEVSVCPLPYSFLQTVTCFCM